MKKTGIILILALCSLFSLAQVERKPSPSRQTDSTGNGPATNTIDKRGMKEMMKDLDLTREQRSKLKEILQSNKAKKDAIENNEQLSDGEKKDRLRALQKEQARSVQSILTEEQKAKFRNKREAMNKKQRAG